MAPSSRAEEDGEKQTGSVGVGGPAESLVQMGVEGMNALDVVEKQQLRTDIPEFRPGDTVKVHVKIKEGDKERVQVFEGICIAQKHGGARATFTVRKISFGHGVERIFPLHSRIIDRVEIVRLGRVRRQKFYYLRE